MALWRSGESQDHGAATPVAPSPLPAEESAARSWRRAHAGSGVTSALMLAYVERVAGRDGVCAMLAEAGMTEREAELRNEGAWFSFEEKIRLWRAAEQVTGDPAIAERVGETILDFRVGTALKRTLRALGTPELVYRNVVRANSKFNWAHSLEVVSRGGNRVRLDYRDISGVGYHPYDCQYTTGLLRVVPQLFGLPPAHVTHRVCGARGENRCEYEIWWTDEPRTLRRAAVVAAVGGVLTAGTGLVVAPLLIPIGAGVGVAAAAVASGQALAAMHRRVHALETQLSDADLRADAQLRSLAALSSELQLDRALAHVTASAGTAIGGARFALLIRGPEGMRADPSSNLPGRVLTRLEQWATRSERELGNGPVVLDSLAHVPLLRELAFDEQLPLGSACAAPLVFRDELLGVLLALAPGATAFLPHDARSLEVYASHAAIALWNARLVSRLEREAAEDPLTGLANRRAFAMACRTEMERAARDDGSAALVVIDIDHFKIVNDTNGHAYGDRVLVEVARVLRTVVRGLDTVARIGGEEFALLLPGTDLGTAWTVAERARTEVALADLPYGPITCSAGVAVTAGPAALTADPLRVADEALYEAKRRGRNQTVVAAALTG